MQQVQCMETLETKLLMNPSLEANSWFFFSALCDLLLAALEPMSWFNVHVYRIAGYFRTDFIFEQQLRVEN